MLASVQPDTTSAKPAAWTEAIASYAGSADAKERRAFADQVFDVLRSGESRTTNDGQRVTLAATPDAQADSAAVATIPSGNENVICPVILRCESIPAPYEDVTVSGTRGNLDFDNGGSAVSQAPGSYSDSDFFEPRDAVKGDVARMIFYKAVRYDGGDGFANLEPNNSVGNGSAPAIGKLSVLLWWNSQDPPDSFEMRRNDVIYEQFQHNRNPFVDHPEWASSIWR